MLKNFNKLIDKIFYWMGYIPKNTPIPVVKEQSIIMERIVIQKKIPFFTNSITDENFFQMQKVKRGMQEELLEMILPYVEWQETTDPATGRVCDMDCFKLKLILWVGKK